MEWFKHKTNSLDDPDFSAIIDEFGSDGYMMFFGLLEIYGREYSNTDSEQFLNIRLAFVARKLRKSSAKVRKFLNFCEKSISKARFVSVINGAMLSYKAPEFIELSSNWTKRKKKLPTEAPTEAPTAIRSRRRSKKKNKEKDINKYTQNFKIFYLKYPLKKAKAQAFISWQKLKTINQLPDLKILLTAIEQQSKEKEIKNTDGQFCPEWKHPATWLNQKCWEDEVNLSIKNKNNPYELFK